MIFDADDTAIAYLARLLRESFETVMFSSFERKILTLEHSKSQNLASKSCMHRIIVQKLVKINVVDSKLEDLAFESNFSLCYSYFKYKCI